MKVTPWPTKDAGLDRHAFTNEGVAADLAVIADLGAFLNFNEGPDPRFVSNLAAIKVDEGVDSHVPTELHVRRNSLIIR